MLLLPLSGGNTALAGASPRDLSEAELRSHGAEFTSGESTQSLMKLISSCNASKTLNANNMETLIECQSEGDIKEHPLLVSSESEDSICQLIEIKKRKKVLSWPSLMRRLPLSSDFSGASEPELKASLFDQPLSVICDDDTLPRPIQDILAILYLKGPSTEGIFRKAANEKARKELKEELNSGGIVDLESLPVHLLAVVLKDFLRSIPQKLLSCDLFEEWMGALEKKSEEGRIEALKQVADQLPRPNLLLLKPLLSMLYWISKNSETSKMDASNLAICVGPSMLTRGDAQSLSLEAQKDLNHKVNTLVEFLIDNCLEMFGENILAHSRITSDDSLEHTDSSDVSTLQNDSAYDSNDPDAEASSRVSSPGRQPQAAAEPRDLQQTWELSPESTASAVTRLRNALGHPERSHSEPSVWSSLGCLEGRDPAPTLPSSNADPTVAPAGSGLESEDPEDPFPEEVFPASERKQQGPPGLSRENVAQDSGSPCGLAPKAPSSGSLDASSEGSPLPSPASPKRNLFTRHRSFTKGEKSKPSREIKKHSMSFSFASHKRGLTKTPSFSSVKSKDVSKDQVSRGFKKEIQLAGRIIREGWPESHSHPALDFSPRPCALSTEEVFRLVDERSPGKPPSYQEAIRCRAPELAACGGQTVDSMRAWMLSLEVQPPPALPHLPRGESRTLCSQEPLGGHRTESWEQKGADCASTEPTGHVTVTRRPELLRLRTLSESRQKNKQDYLVRTCSQPVFEAHQLLYARESYI
ncbi:T-cell activation Rho GTPase-activating protein [Talpa occidentalis]|uniref:T-cell activation Rho GTPase-activating protein n=1 Tax=Talpa occidentalis TaxID=50954 RepID=UPI00188EC8C2|nr:T-cell activation Rho GTPase-activating protein [Talpa occidentalis]